MGTSSNVFIAKSIETKVESKDEVYLTSKFTGRTIPKEVEMYKGNITKDGKDYPFDSIDVYQRCLAGQGFAVIAWESEGKTVICLMPAFSPQRDPKLIALQEEQKKFLRENNIPYVESENNIMGYRSGLVHVRTCIVIGLDKSTVGMRVGMGLYKPLPGQTGHMLFNSQSQNCPTVAYDEFFLLANALNRSKDELDISEEEPDTEWYIRRMLPPDLANFFRGILQIMLQEKYNEIKERGSALEYKYLDSGDWLKLKDCMGMAYDQDTVKIIEAWKTKGLEEKMDLLRGTLFKAIRLQDPKTLVERDLHRDNPRSIVQRILALNKERKLALNLDQPESKLPPLTPLELAVLNKLPHVVKLLCEHGANINHVNQENENSSPLLMALQEGNSEMVELLLTLGAKPACLKDADCDYDFLYRNNKLSYETVRNLLEYKVPVNDFPLEQMIRVEKPAAEEIITLLLKRGADTREVYLIGAVPKLADIINLQKEAQQSSKDKTKSKEKSFPPPLGRPKSF